MTAQYPPGPRDHVFGLRTLSRVKADPPTAYLDLQRTYGDSVSFRTGPYRLFAFFHPDQVREVLVTHAKSLIRLPREMQVLGQWNGNSVLIAEGDQWIRQRRLVQPAFQPRRFESYGRMMVACARALVESWRQQINQSGYLDVELDEAMTSLSLTVICKTMFDRDAADLPESLGEAVRVLSDVAYHEMQAPILWPSWLPTKWNWRKRWAIEVLDGIAWQMIHHRRQEGRDHGDLLSMLLAAVDEDTGGRPVKFATNW